MKSSCKRTDLASGGTFRVDTCAACGTVNLHIGALTLRLEPAAMEQLSKVLSEATAKQQKLARQRVRPSMIAGDAEDRQLEELGLSLAMLEDIEKIVH